MGVIKGLFNTLADPRLFFILACDTLILYRVKFQRTVAAHAAAAE